MNWNHLYEILKSVNGVSGKLVLSMSRERKKKSIIHRLVRVAQDWYRPPYKEWLEDGILIAGNDSGHLEFRCLSKADKTKWILKKFKIDLDPSEEPVIYTKRRNKGYWYVPCYTSIRRDLIENRKVNRYLSHQHQRIVRCVKLGRLDTATRIFTTLLQKSWSFRVANINRAVKGWFFQHDYKYLSKWLTTLDMDLRKLNFDAKFWRVYIPKDETNTKFRPLGVPDLSWRVILSMHTSFLNLIIPQTLGTLEETSQYGFRPGLSAKDAWLRVLKGIQEGKKLYEFDLDGCFNRISCKHVSYYLNKAGLPPYYTLYLEGLLSSIPLNIKDNELKDERELIKDKGIVWKYGLPQGFSVSPLMTILVIDRAMKKANMGDYVMYADDGILLRDGLTSPYNLEQAKILQDHGMHFSKKLKKDGTDSCRWIRDEFTFLGVRLSISRWSFLLPHETWIKHTGFFQELSFYPCEEDFKWDLGICQGVWLPVPFVDDKVWRMLLYSDESESSLKLKSRSFWRWEIDPGCFALINSSISSQRNWNLMKKWIAGDQFSQRVENSLLFLDAQQESTLSSRTLLSMRHKFMRDTKVKRIRMENMFHREVIPEMPEVTKHLSWVETGLQEKVMNWVADHVNDPLQMTQDLDLMSHIVDNCEDPNFRQRSILERRTRRLEKSWKMPVEYGDYYIPIWLAPYLWKNPPSSSRLRESIPRRLSLACS